MTNHVKYVIVISEDNVVLSHKNKEEQTMGNRGTDRKSPKFFANLGILIGFITEAATVILFRMSEEELQHHMLQKAYIRKQLRAMFKIADTFVEEKEQWRKFYQKHFSLELNFADIVIPKRPSVDTWRLLIIAQGLTLSQVYKSMSAAFKCWKYADDLDKVVIKNARDTKHAYAIWVHDRVEPDVQYLGHSTKKIDPDMTIGVTLLERMIHEIVYFDETGEHLDIKGVTFCSGSRGSNGGVPGADWRADAQEVRVCWCRLDYSDAKYGVREAVAA